VKDYRHKVACRKIPVLSTVSMAFCQSNCNATTGLPLALDLIDQDVGIARGFTREFVEEVEATLARDPDLDKFELETRFSSPNPQKNE
jgi:hypothetical protein